ncbi:MAG TPA: SRPBCC family protein [Thermoanaerobaculia bacterium]|jgi:uncharacterized protein YndB with AHSA1/START domain|nr:SRPBCC family protein [Thermoanaerobaculia bacterium]
MADLIAKATTTVDAPAEIVWDALVTPSIIKEYMFGTNVVSDWKEGSPIVWKGEWQGKAYEDKGVIQKIEPHRRLQYTHSSAGSDEVHTITIELAEKGAQTEVTLSQDNNATEEAREHSEKNWQMMLDGLKKLLEQ